MGHRVHWHDRCHSSQYLVSIFESPTFWLRVFRLSNIFKYFTEKTSFSDYNFKVSSKMCQCLKKWFGQILKPISDSKRSCSSNFFLLRYFFFPSCLFMLCVSIIIIMIFCYCPKHCFRLIEGQQSAGVGVKISWVKQ